MNWRLIDTGYNSAFYNMAVDEALLKLSKVPILRFYGWKPSAVSLGYFQDINDINLKFCRENNIDVVRRITGGKAILHDKELTYSFIIDENKVSKNVIDSYKLISNSILIALKNLGINAKFKDENVKKDKTPACLNNPSWYEIVVENKKIAAAAQTRKNKKLLQHGPILISMDYKKNLSIFKKNNKMSEIFHPVSWKSSISRILKNRFAIFGKPEIPKEFPSSPKISDFRVYDWWPEANPTRHYGKFLSTKNHPSKRQGGKHQAKSHPSMTGGSLELLEETKKRIISLKQLNKKINKNNLKKELKKGFEENFNVKFKESGLTKKEKDLIKKLVKEKYKTKKWNYKR